MTDVIEIDEFDANWIKEVAGTVPPTTGAVATAVGPDVWAYSPGQKRDSVGRFGSGGGGTPSGSGGDRPGIAGVGAGDPEKVVVTFADGGRDYGLKRGGVEREAQIRQWDSEGHGPYTWEAVGVREGHGDHALNAMQGEWSMGHDSAHSVLIQSSAAGAGLGTGMVWAGRESDQYRQFEPSPTSMALAKAQYDRTQRSLSSGPESFTVYRGVGSEQTTKNVLESWTTNRKIAESFGSHVMERTVPREAVFMDNRYGGGIGGERELVLLGSKR